MNILLKIIMIIMITFTNMKMINNSEKKSKILEPEKNITKDVSYDFTSYQLRIGKDSNTIINSEQEFKDFINQLKKEKSDYIDRIQEMEVHYSNFDFNSKSLVAVDASGSGCDKNINELEKITIDDDTVNVKLDGGVGGATCAAYWPKIYIIEIEKGNYNKVIVN